MLKFSSFIFPSTFSPFLLFISCFFSLPFLRFVHHPRLHFTFSHFKSLTSRSFKTTLSIKTILPVNLKKQRSETSMDKKNINKKIIKNKESKLTRHNVLFPFFHNLSRISKMKKIKQYQNHTKIATYSWHTKKYSMEYDRNWLTKAEGVFNLAKIPQQWNIKLISKLQAIQMT